MAHNQRFIGYTRLKAKVLLQLLAVAAGAFAFIILLYELVWAGRGADFIVGVLHRVFGFSYQAALGLYQDLIRNNAGLILVAFSGLVFLLFLWLFLSWFTRYFSQINQGIDALVQEDGAPISLPRELAAIEAKLNTVRENLATRAQAAQLAEQRKNELVAYLAHDIRTPLTSVIGYLSLMNEAADMPATQRARYTGITLDKALRLEKLVNELFEITRLNLQGPALQKETIDLYYLLAQVADEVYPMLVARGNSAALHASQQLSVQGDAMQLARVFTNLLKNAAAYSDAGTEIHITAQQQAGMVEVAFQNTGPAIPQEKLAAVFDKFCRLDEARASNTGGAGLGLSIAREIVLQHGGSISAHSQGNIVTFIVLLPAQNYNAPLSIS